MSAGEIRNEEQERRRFARIANHFFVRSCRAGSEEEKTAGIVHDIHPSGLAFLTDQVYQVGEILEIEVEFVGLKFPAGEDRGLLNSPMIAATAAVTRVESMGPDFHLAAVVFDPLPERDRALIGRAVSYQKQLEA